ncbi:MAG: SUMF1/EgtB/PvdO family nonheme iron enzyme [Deltaproteobacteria bacterium]|nr:SUMF1/EgtB/PvdO family nonheme iron enzyme [Deltaproteobacteria bacterium]
MADEGFKRKLSAILSADVKGYSRLMDDDEEATVRTLTTYRTAISEFVQQFRGRVIDTPGDNILTEFPSVVDAVNCAVEIQRELAERNADLPDNRKMVFRIGINLGDVIEEDGRIYGDGVNIAAHIETLADPGGISISNAVYNQVHNKLQLRYKNQGARQVKNIVRPVRIYKVLPSCESADAVSELFDLEHEYRQRLKARYDEEARYYVPLSGETTEISSCQTVKATRSERRRRHRAKFEYHEWIASGQDIKKVKLESLKEAVEKYPCIIVLGDPGCGKTTALENLAYQFSDRPETLPLPLHLSEFEYGMSLHDFILQGWGGDIDAGHWGAIDLAANVQEYLNAGKLFFMFDALNEMPTEGYRERCSALRRFMEKGVAQGNRFLMTCRLLDYGDEFSGLQRVEVQPLSGDQIRRFLQNELPDDWEGLWRALIRAENSSPQFLEMVRNPYLLTIMIDIYHEDSILGGNRAELMRRFIQILLDWAKTKCPPDQWLDADIQSEALSIMAFEMQARSGFGTRVKTEQIKSIMPRQVQLDPKWPPQPSPPSQILRLAAKAKIIEMPVDNSTVRFSHQLIQEYFAAHQVLKKSPANMADLWRWPWYETEMPLWLRPENNYEPPPPPPPTGWEETTILAVGSALENDNQLLRSVLEINPILAGRCLLQIQDRCNPTDRKAVIDRLLRTISDPEVALRVRISAGELLGSLGDPRIGEMIVIPAGKFLMGEGREQHLLYLSEYKIGKYPVTNAEYKLFLAADGYKNKSYWTEAGWQEICIKQDKPRLWHDDRYNKPNQPVIGLSWYACVAYCRWLSRETGRLIRLPTEAEWEKAARGIDGRTYPWGDEFEAVRLNAREGNQKVCTTTPIGIYQSGKSPFGLFDCSGNVWEWCATRWKKPYPYLADKKEWDSEYLEGQNLRVLRGGSWNYKAEATRCANRFKFQPYGWTERGGFRFVVQD